ncbi:ferrous iron transport protein B [Bowdeniella nasicola]|uniref:Ferrous iron transport protein B n=1 Tax=Bowdeniella nasicola TaxID=208480 RepID=A0A1H3X4C0_9ACTO|nr:ferrous iron transport protein B [Bowdeniella nasicola]SDZ94249.1 ferrous iron transport protein B [Bowdeniella nasicola]
MTLESSPKNKTASLMLVGNPNTGKSTLFNRMTGSHQDVRNAPGTTVEMFSGTWGALGARVTDLPGTYSLLAKSPDEQVTADAIAAPGTDLALVMLDATALARSLYLLGQVAQFATPVVGILTMGDIAEASGEPVAAERLAAALAIPVVAVNPRTGAGLSELAAVVADALASPSFVCGFKPAPREVPEIPVLTEPGCRCVGTSSCCTPPATAAPDVPREGAAPLAEELAEAEHLFAWVESIMGAIGADAGRGSATRSDRIDRFLLHPLIGIPVFLFLMWTLFQLTTAVAEPIMDWAESLVTGPVTSGVVAVLGGAGIDVPWLHGFLIDGILAGVGTVLSFVPLMAIMFAAIAILEDSGYLARAAFTADRAMRLIGLDGRAIMPLIVGFGCNLPALAATRTLPNARQRLITAILVPYASCAARLTVYILLATAFFGSAAGNVIFAMYLVSILLIVLGGLVMRAIVGEARSRNEPLLLVLPAYQLPRLAALAASTWRRVKAFITGAGSVIIATLTLVWLLQAIPVTGGHRIADVPVEDSLYGTVAEGIAPAFAPAGYGSWQASSALITGFVAKEVVVGNMAQSFAVDEPDDPHDAGTLGEKIRANFNQSSGGHGKAAALAFLIFVLAYTPCLATLAEQRRMLGFKITGAALLVQLALAWVLSVGVFNVARLWW